MAKKFLFIYLLYTLQAFGGDLADEFYRSGLFYLTSDYIKDEKEATLFLKAESLFFLGDYKGAYEIYSLLKDKSLDDEKFSIIDYRIGDCLWFTDKKEKAISFYKDALARLPNNPQAPYAIFRTIQYYIEKGDYDEATSFLSEHPNIPWKDTIFYLLGNTFENTKDYDRAILYYKKIITVSKDDELKKHAILSLARHYYNIKDFENAFLYAKGLPSDNGYIISFASLFNMKKYKEAIAIFPKISHPTKELYLAYAESLYNLGKFEEAASAYIKGGGTGTGISYSYIKLGKIDLALKHPNDDKSLYLIAQLGNDDEKVIAYRKIIQEYPKSIFKEEAFLNLSLLYLKMGSNTQAYEICDKMIKEYPKSNLSLISLYNIGITLENEEYLLKLTKLYPNFAKNPEILYKIGSSKIKRNKYKEALEIFTSLIEKYPDTYLFPYCLFNLAFLYNNTGSPKKARAIYRSIPSIDRNLGEKALFYAGNISFNLKDYNIAIIDYQTLINKYPNSGFIVPSIYQIGWCYYKKEQFKEAAKWFTKIILYYKDSPYFPKALYWLGWCYFMEGMYESAKEAYFRLQREALDHPLSADAYIRIGLCFYNQGKYKEAIEQYQRLIEKGADRELLEEALYQIKEAFIKQNRPGEAINYYKLFLEKSADRELNKEIRKQLAQIYYLDGKKREAREEYRKLLEMGIPDDEKAEVYYWIGRTFLPFSKNEAIFYFRKVVELYPKSKWAADALFRRGVILYEASDYKNAKDAFSSLIKNYKDREDLIKEAKVYLKKIK